VLAKSSNSDPAHVDVTFTHPVAEETRTVFVVGDFNDWSQDAHPMVLEGDAASCTIPLPAGRTHRFRYLVDGERWENDWAADAYVPNSFGADDSVVDLTDVMPPAKTAKKATKKAAPAAKKAAATKKAAPAKKAPAAKKAAATKRQPPTTS
jgi:1,4-alpha-glucan branching enzyme